MGAQPQHVDDPESELYRLLAEADRQPVELEKDGIRYRLVRLSRTDSDRDAPATPYDPERMIRAIHASAGALKDGDTDALLRTLREERTQNSAGRPAE